MNQSTLLNFIPTRPLEQIAEEYVNAFWKLYEPATYLQRCYRYSLELGQPKGKRPFKWPLMPELRAVFKIIWLQGIKRPETRAIFWKNLFSLLQKNPGAVDPYLTVCAHGEHFFEFRQEIRAKIQDQLGKPIHIPDAEPVLVKTS